MPFGPSWPCWTWCHVKQIAWPAHDPYQSISCFSVPLYNSLLNSTILSTTTRGSAPFTHCSVGGKKHLPHTSPLNFISLTLKVCPLAWHFHPGGEKKVMTMYPNCASILMFRQIYWCKAGNRSSPFMSSFVDKVLTLSTRRECQECSCSYWHLWFPN